MAGMRSRGEGDELDDTEDELDGTEDELDPRLATSERVILRSPLDYREAFVQALNEYFTLSLLSGNVVGVTGGQGRPAETVTVVGSAVASSA